MYWAIDYEIITQKGKRTCEARSRYVTIVLIIVIYGLIMHIRYDIIHALPQRYLRTSPYILYDSPVYKVDVCNETIKELSFTFGTIHYIWDINAHIFISYSLFHVIDLFLYAELLIDARPIMQHRLPFEYAIWSLNDGLCTLSWHNAINNLWQQRIDL